MPMTLNGSGTGTVGVPNQPASQNSTSGTTVGFTGLPSGVKRITVQMANVSMSGTAQIWVQIGSGAYTTTGYSGVAGYFGASGGSNSWASGGFEFPSGLNNSSNTFTGQFVLTAVTSTLWVGSLNASCWGTGSNFLAQSNGFVTISGAVDRVRLITSNGTDTFDSGTVNIIYE